MTSPGPSKKKGPSLGRPATRRRPRGSTGATSPTTRSPGRKREGNTLTGRQIAEADGPLALVGQCQNSGGTPVARVTVQQSSGEHFQVFLGEVSSAKTTSTGAAATIVQATASGGLPVWHAARHTFTVVTNPAAALQGSATAITNSGFGADECYVAAWAFAG